MCPPNQYVTRPRRVASEVCVLRSHASFGVSCSARGSCGCVAESHLCSRPAANSSRTCARTTPNAKLSEHGPHHMPNSEWQGPRRALPRPGKDHSGPCHAPRNRGFGAVLSSEATRILGFHYEQSEVPRCLAVSETWEPLTDGQPAGVKLPIHGGFGGRNLRAQPTSEGVWSVRRCVRARLSRWNPPRATATAEGRSTTCF